MQYAKAATTIAVRDRTEKLIVIKGQVYIYTLSLYYWILLVFTHIQVAVKMKRYWFINNEPVEDWHSGIGQSIMKGTDKKSKKKYTENLC